MVAVGFGLIWAGYAIGIYGYCLVQGYDVSFRQVFRMQWPGITIAPSTLGQKTAQAASPQSALGA